MILTLGTDSKYENMKATLKIIFRYLSETLWVMKTFDFHKLKYLFQRFGCRTHPFSRTAYDILMFNKL